MALSRKQTAKPIIFSCLHYVGCARGLLIFIYVLKVIILQAEQI